MISKQRQDSDEKPLEEQLELLQVVLIFENIIKITLNFMLHSGKNRRNDSNK